ncbi:MAG TPA: hypothetical protein VED01_27475 [Burkholderiales bacterium]|nr:hypothetical protein [Burkholderiales bacterium]
MKLTTCCAAGVLAAAITSGPAVAQSLALTYKLEPKSEPAREAAAPFGRCAGFNWLTALETCGKDLIARILPPRSEAHFAPVTELPDLGTPAPHRFLKSSGGREALIGNARAPDFMLRLGSKYRFKSTEDGTWEWYRFHDITYESYIKNNSFKAVGVELLVPFQ